jgi:hypothetical protein
MFTDIPTYSKHGLSGRSIDQCYLCFILKSLSSKTHEALDCIQIPGSASSKQLRIQHGKTNSGANRRTVHLHVLLSRTSDAVLNRRLALARKQRFGIAAALTWSVLHLCDSPWLGKTLQNDEIQLFLESQTDTNLSYLFENPYLSYNFSSPPSAIETYAAAQNAPRSESENFQSNQIKNMILFTLTIRLIELG